MRYTLYCEYGRLGRPGAHFLHVGEWIRPDGHVVLCHGTMTDDEWESVNMSGYCVLVDDSRTHTVRVRQLSDARSTRWLQEKRPSIDGNLVCGILRRKSGTIYSGYVTLHGI